MADGETGWSRHRWEVAAPLDAPTGLTRLVGRALVPSTVRHVGVALAGGGMSSGYFDLDAPGYSMAEHLASAGVLTILPDPPGTSPASTPEDAYALSPSVVVALYDHAVAQLVQRPPAAWGTGELDRFPLVGMGHSMGSMLAVFQQAAHRRYAALAVLGYSARGLPEVLTPDELAWPGADVDGTSPAATAALAELAATRFRRPLPVASTVASEYLVVVPIGAEVVAALATASAPLLALCGLASMIPGSHTGQREAIDVRVFCGVAEHDITGPPEEAAASFPNAAEVTAYVQPGAGHNANVAPTRRELWDRLVAWIEQLNPSRTDG